jgi:phosphatidylserine/phosphatidylglycerophosphate/cardiolipin synthase-like enzyme
MLIDTRMIMSNSQWRQGVTAFFSALLAAGLVVWSPSAGAQATSLPAGAAIEVAFSPGSDAEQLVIKNLDAASTSIRMLAYSFTSAPITRALVRARKRGVDVAIAVDYRECVALDRSGKARAALGALVLAGIPVRTVSTYAAHHDKVAVVDGRNTQTGSFNYSTAAAKSNSENAIVIWNDADLARAYLRHWQRNWDRGEQFRPAF